MSLTERIARAIDPIAWTGLCLSHDGADNTAYRKKKAREVAKRVVAEISSQPRTQEVLA